MFNTKPYVLEASYIRTAFQMSAELDVKKSIFGTVKYNGTIIYNWAKEKFVGLQMPDNIQDFSKNRAGQEVNILYDLNTPYFCIKASHPDKSVAGRVWTTEAEIIVNDGKALLGVKLYYSTPMKRDVEIVDFSVPTFVKRIYRENGIRDVRDLKPTAWEVNEENIDELFDFIQNSNRKIPVVVVTESANVEGIGGQYLSGFLVNGNNLALKVKMLAHIVCLSYEVSQLWNERVGKNWGVYNGAIRTYFPGVDFSNDTYREHPLAVPNRILATYYEDEEGKEFIAGEAFKYVLRDNLRKYNTNVRLEWEKFGHKFYFIANREKLQNKERTVEDAVLLNTMYEEQIQQLEEKIKSQEDEILTAKCLLDDREEEIEDNKKTIYRLNNRVDSLTAQIDKLRKKGQSDIPILNDYESVQDWIETYFPGKLVLHKRAIRALKGAIFDDVELVYKSLKLLGTTYYQMRMGYIQRKEFDNQCAELGVEEAGSVTDISAGELGDTYYVSYHGKKCKLDRHLRKGKVRDPHFCMRIYFFWSEEECQIVIGWLPQHLTISTS